MKKEIFADLIKKTEQEICCEIVENKKNLFQFRMINADSAVKPHVVKAVRRHIARLKTALAMKVCQTVLGE